MEINLEHLLGSNELDLYSADTVARKREETRSLERDKLVTGSKSKIRLLDPDEPRTHETEGEEQGATGESLPGSEPGETGCPDSMPTEAALPGFLTQDDTSSDAAQTEIAPQRTPSEGASAAEAKHPGD